MAAVVILLQVGLRRVERVRIFHRELTDADQSGAGTAFVAELRLDLVDHERVFLIRLAVFAHKVNSCFLVRHTEYIRAAVAVRKAEQLAADAFIAAGFLPERCGHHDGKLYFLTVDRIHFLANDLLNFASDPAKRQI